MNDKYCVDCKYYLYNLAVPKCTNPAIVGVNLVTGGLEKEYCELMRIEKCDTKLHFEQKAVESTYWERFNNWIRV